MPNETPKRSAHALPNRDCAPQERFRALSDARFRKAFRMSQARAEARVWREFDKLRTIMQEIFAEGGD